MIATVGLDSVIVVETKDAVLVANGDNAQDIKKIVDQLKAENRVEHEFHREVYRPCGRYESIDNGERYQVKRITLKLGENYRYRCTTTAPSNGSWYQASHW